MKIKRRKMAFQTGGIPEKNRVFGADTQSSTRLQFEQIDRIVDEFVQDTAFEGIVCVRIGESVHTKSVGCANKSGVKHSNDELFPICSITKLLTAAAILKLVDRGELALDAKVSKFIDDKRKIFQDVTVKELLTHTSGIPDLTPEGISFKEPATYDQIYESLVKEQKRPNRGQEHYNNFGYVTLAKVIEKVTGLSYEEAMEKEVFHPLGINAKAPMRTDEMPKNVEGLPSNPSEMPLVQDSPEVRIGDGNIYFSARYLITFEKALSNDKFLTTPRQKLLYDSHMGFDHQPFEEPFRSKNIEVRGKSGAMGDPFNQKPTISTVLYSIPQKNICIVVLSNKELSGKANWAADLGEKILSSAIPI
jgi:CubicO group peptidase (beta-lactamase class C family)